jgi:hypothetical protein
MKSRKNRNYSRRNRKGGFLFNSKVAPSLECDINNLSTLSKDTGDGQDPLNKMQQNYLKCCPKDFMGRKNSSPYCKQLNMNFDTLTQHKRDITGYYGDETDVSKIKQIMSQSTPIPNPTINTSYKKPWYKFWGGKKTRKHRKTKKSRRNLYMRK